MSGTYLEVGGSSSGNGGGGGGSPYWKDAVANFAALPAGSVIGEARLAQDTQIIYVWDGSIWKEEDDTKVNRAGDTMTGALLANGGIDVTATGGTDTLAIGTSNADIINIGRSGATVNVQGTTAFQNVTNYVVADKNITINSGGSAGSASGAGLDVEENSIITGYSRTSADRNSWELKAPNTAGIAVVTPGAGGITLDQSSHNPVTIGTANGLSLATQQISLGTSSGSTTGALTSTDWSTFNNKEPAITAGTATQYYRGDKTFQELTPDALTAIVDGSSPSSSNIFEELNDGTYTLSTTGIGATSIWGTAGSTIVPAGRWMIGGIAYVQENGANLLNLVSAAVTDQAVPSGLLIGEYMQTAFQISGNNVFSIFVPYRLYSFNSPTTFYVNTRFQYSSGTPQHCGIIVGWRI